MNLPADQQLQSSGNSLPWYAISATNSKYSSFDQQSLPVFLETQLQDVADFHTNGRNVDSEFPSLIDTVDRFVERYITNLHQLVESQQKEKNDNNNNNNSQQSNDSPTNKVTISLPSILLVAFRQSDVTAIQSRILDEIAVSERFEQVEFLPLILQSSEEFLSLLDQTNNNPLQLIQTAGYIVSIPAHQVDMVVKSIYEPMVGEGNGSVDMEKEGLTTGIIPGVNSTTQQNYSTTLTSNLNPIGFFDYCMYQHTFYNYQPASAVATLSLIRLLLRNNGLFFLNAISSPIISSLLYNDINTQTLSRNGTILETLCRQYGINKDEITPLLSQFLPPKNLITQLFTPQTNNTTHLIITPKSPQSQEIPTSQFECINALFCAENIKKMIKSDENCSSCQSDSLLKWLPYDNSHIVSLYVDSFTDYDTDVPIGFDSLYAKVDEKKLLALNEDGTVNSAVSNPTAEQCQTHTELLNQFQIISPRRFEQILYSLNGTAADNNNNVEGAGNNGAKRQTSLLQPVSGYFQSTPCSTCSFLSRFVQEDAKKVGVANDNNVVSLAPVCSMYHIQHPDQRREFLRLLHLQYTQGKNNDSKNVSVEGLLLTTTPSSSDLHYSQQYPLLFSNDANPTDSDLNPGVPELTMVDSNNFPADGFKLNSLTQHTSGYGSLQTARNNNSSRSFNNQRPPSPSFYYYSMLDDGMSVSSKMLPPPQQQQQQQQSNSSFNQLQQEISVTEQQYNDISESFSTDISLTPSNAQTNQLMSMYIGPSDNQISSLNLPNNRSGPQFDTGVNSPGSMNPIRFNQGILQRTNSNQPQTPSSLLSPANHSSLLLPNPVSHQHPTNNGVSMLYPTRKRSISRNSSSHNLAGVNNNVSNGVIGMNQSTSSGNLTSLTNHTTNNNGSNTPVLSSNASLNTPMNNLYLSTKNNTPSPSPPSLSSHIPTSPSPFDTGFQNNIPQNGSGQRAPQPSLQMLNQLQQSEAQNLPMGPGNGNALRRTTVPSQNDSRAYQSRGNILPVSLSNEQFELFFNMIASFAGKYINPSLEANQTLFQQQHKVPLLRVFTDGLLSQTKHFISTTPSNGYNIVTRKPEPLPIHMYLTRSANHAMFKHEVKKFLLTKKSNKKKVSKITQDQLADRTDDQSQRVSPIVESPIQQQQGEQEDEKGDDKKDKYKVSIIPDDRPIVEARPRVLVSGYSIGLPNASNPLDKDLPRHNYEPDHLERQVFNANNIDKLLGGYSYLSSYTLQEHVKMLAMNPFELGKTPTGERCKKVYTQPEECIQIQSKISHFDLSKQYGVPSYVVEALDMAFQLAIAAGFEALVDAGYPVLTRNKVWVVKSGQTDPAVGSWVEKVTINPLPNPLRETTGVIFVSSFPGMDSIVDEVERCSVSQMRTEVIRMLKEHPLACGAPSHINDDLKLNEIISKLDTLSEPSTQTNQSHTGLTSPMKQIPEKNQNNNIFNDIISSLEQHPLYEYNRKLLFKVLVMANSQLAELLHLTGQNTHVNAACAGTTQAIAIADDWLRNTRRCEAVVVIAADIATSKRLLPYISTGFMVLGAATKLKGIANGSAPFDVRRKGMIVGAGACAMVLETHYRMTQRRNYDLLYPNHLMTFVENQIITTIDLYKDNEKDNVSDDDEDDYDICDINQRVLDPLPTWKLEPVPAHPSPINPNPDVANNKSSPWQLPVTWSPQGELLMSHFANSAFHASLIHTAHIAQELNRFLTQVESLYARKLRIEWEDKLIAQDKKNKAKCHQKSKSKDVVEANELQFSFPVTHCTQCQADLMQAKASNMDCGDAECGEDGDCDGSSPLTLFPWKRELSKQLLYFSHETSTASCAKVEMNALRSYFGSDLLSNVIVCNTKGFTGHAMGVAFEDVIAVAALKKQITPPIANLINMDPVFSDVTLSLGGPVSVQNDKLFTRLYEDYRNNNGNCCDENKCEDVCPNNTTCDNNQNGQEYNVDYNTPSFQNVNVVDKCCNCTPLYSDERTLSLRFSAGFGSQLAFLLFKQWVEDPVPTKAELKNEGNNTINSMLSSRYQHSYDIVPVLHPHKRDEIWAAHTTMQTFQLAQVSSVYQSFVEHVSHTRRFHLQSQYQTTDLNLAKRTLANQLAEVKPYVKSIFPTINAATMAGLTLSSQSNCNRELVVDPAASSLTQTNRILRSADRTFRSFPLRHRHQPQFVKQMQTASQQTQSFPSHQYPPHLFQQQQQQQSTRRTPQVTINPTTPVPSSLNGLTLPPHPSTLSLVSGAGSASSGIPPLPGNEIPSLLTGLSSTVNNTSVNFQNSTRASPSMSGRLSARPSFESQERLQEMMAQQQLEQLQQQQQQQNQ